MIDVINSAIYNLVFPTALHKSTGSSPQHTDTVFLPLLNNRATYMKKSVQYRENPEHDWLHTELDLIAL